MDLILIKLLPLLDKDIIDYFQKQTNSNTTSREGSPVRGSSPSTSSSGLYSPNGSMSPDGPSVFKLSFISPPPARGVGRAGG